MTDQKIPRLRRILILNAEGGDGGIETYSLGAVRYLRDRVDEVIVGAPNNGKFLERAIQEGATTWDVGMSSKFDLSAARRLAKYLEQHPIDLINAQQERTLLLGFLAMRMLPLRARPVLIQTEHNRTLDRLRSRRHVREMRRSTVLFHRLVSRKCGGFIAVSKAVKRFLVEAEDIQPESVVVVPVGVAPESMVARMSQEEARSKLGIEKGSAVIINIAKLTPQKDFPTFLEMARLVVGRRPGAQFLIAGAGPEEDQLKELTASLGISNCVRFLGFRRDVAELLAASDILVLTSQWEGLPRVVLEAMAARKPVVATAVSGVPEAVADGVTGLLVPRENPERAAEAVIRLIDEPNTRSALGEAGFARLCSEFSEESVVRKLLGGYQYLYSRATSRSAELEVSSL